jgi:hypothetical protein
VKESKRTSKRGRYSGKLTEIVSKFITHYVQFSDLLLPLVVFRSRELA